MYARLYVEIQLYVQFHRAMSHFEVEEVLQNLQVERGWRGKSQHFRHVVT